MSNPNNLDLVESCAKRTSFQLSYKRSRVKRQFHEEGISGPEIDCSYSPKAKASGEWCNGGKLSPDADNDWSEDFIFSTFFDSAINEAVHETLEWFTIDGIRALDPHDHKVEDRIYTVVESFAQQLWQLRKEILGE